MSTSDVSDAINEVISNLIASRTGFSFKGDDFRKLCGPIVYIFMLKGKALYVGMSSEGLARPGGKHHHQADRARAGCDEVMIWECVSVAAAKQLEAILIEKARPLFNQRGKSTILSGLLGVGKSAATRYRNLAPIDQDKAQAG